MTIGGVVNKDYDTHRSLIGQAVSKLIDYISQPRVSYLTDITVVGIPVL